MKLGETTVETEIVLGDEFEEFKYRVRVLEEELRKLKQYVEEATRLK